MNLLLSIHEFEQAIKKLIFHMFLVLTVSHLILSKRWINKIDYIYIKYVTIILKMIFPKKDKLSDSNNWRGINLLDIVSKVMSLVITSRLQHVLKSEFTPIQFGTSPKTECPEGSFSLKSLLQMRKEHDLNSWVIFVDLIKNFDSIHHGLIFELLKKLKYLLVL